MNVIINGFRYETDISIEIGSFDTGFRNWSSWCAMLYKTPRINRYFLSGSGGLMTVFQGKTRIIPLTQKAAKAWAECHLSQEAVETFFPEDNETNPTNTITGGS
jgi:hypothetical protein